MPSKYSIILLPCFQIKANVFKFETVRAFIETSNATNNVAEPAVKFQILLFAELVNVFLTNKFANVF